MDKAKAFVKSDFFFAVFLLVVVSALVYLPFISRFGYFNDDWYEMYAAHVRGAMVFKDLFSIDRPGRALLMIPAYWLFGDNALYYNLSAYAFRVAGALCLLWLLRMLWPQQKTATT